MKGVSLTSRFVCGVVTCDMDHATLFNAHTWHLGFAEIYDVRDEWHGYFALVSICNLNYPRQ